jgi:hypothetical protein
MIIRTALVACALLLTACGSVTNQQVSTIVVDGNAYEYRQRTIDGQGGSYTSTSVRVGGSYYNCLPDSPGDCEAAVRRGLSRIGRF